MHSFLLHQNDLRYKQCNCLVVLTDKFLLLHQIYSILRLDHFQLSQQVKVRLSITEVKILEGHMVQDHVHMLIAIPPK